MGGGGLEFTAVRAAAASGPAGETAVSAALRISTAPRDTLLRLDPVVVVIKDSIEGIAGLLRCDTTLCSAHNNEEDCDIGVPSNGGRWPNRVVGIG